MSRTGLTWPFPVGTVTTCPTVLNADPLVVCNADTIPGQPTCTRCAPGYEPTDTELAAHGIHTEPTDPGDSPSYTTLTKGPTK